MKSTLEAFVLHKPVVIASCEQRVGHTREQLPCPVCDWAVSMSDNVGGLGVSFGY